MLLEMPRDQRPIFFNFRHVGVALRPSQWSNMVRPLHFRPCRWKAQVWVVYRCGVHWRRTRSQSKWLVKWTNMNTTDAFQASFSRVAPPVVFLSNEAKGWKWKLRDLKKQCFCSASGSGFSAMVAQGSSTSQGLPVFDRTMATWAFFRSVPAMFKGNMQFCLLLPQDVKSLVALWNQEYIRIVEGMMLDTWTRYRHHHSPEGDSEASTTDPAWEALREPGEIARFYSGKGKADWFGYWNASRQSTNSLKVDSCWFWVMSVSFLWGSSSGRTVGTAKLPWTTTFPATVIRVAHRLGSPTLHQEMAWTPFGSNPHAFKVIETSDEHLGIENNRTG